MAHLRRGALVVRVVGVVLLGEMLRPVGLSEQPTVLEHEAPVDGPLGRKLEGCLEIALLLLLDCVTLPDILLYALQVRAVAFPELPDRLYYDLGQVIRAVYLKRLRLETARILKVIQ